MVGVGVLFGLVGLFTHTLLTPFAQPQVHVFVLPAEIPRDVWPESLPSLRPAPAASALLPLIRSWTETAKLPQPHALSCVASGETLDDLFELAKSSEIHSGDVAILVAQSQLVTINGTLYLVDRLNPQHPERGCIPFAKFIEAFRASPAHTKLLCLDAGHLMADLRSGMEINDFGQPLRHIVEQTGDPRLWVLVSHRPGQCSQRVADLKSTVFLDAVARGLQREANQNFDSQISLDELVRFVQHETSAREPQTGGAQTPWLIRGSGRWNAPELETVLAPIPQPTSVAAATPRSPTEHDAPATTSNPVAETRSIARPVTSLTVEELLHEAWALRDQLEQTTDDTLPIRLRIKDFAPYHWNRLLAELVQAEALWASQPERFPPHIQVLLQVRVNDLRTAACAKPDGGSSWLKDVRELQPRPVGEFDTSVSLALVDQWQRWTEGPVRERDVAERETLHRLLVATDPQAFSQWVESKPIQYHAELELAARLSQAGRAWPDIQLAVRVRTRAEELGCHPLALEWFSEDLLRADRLRWYAERKLSDLVRTDDLPTAIQTLREADSLYQEIATATERLTRARRLEADLLADLPHWMNLSRLTWLELRATLSEELTPLVTDLAEFIELLANRQHDDCGRIEQLRHGLQSRRDRLQSMLLPEGLVEPFGVITAGQGELRSMASVLLATPLPTAAQRQTLARWSTQTGTTHPLPHTESESLDDLGEGPVQLDHVLESQFARLLQPLARPGNVPDASARWTLARLQPPQQEEVESGSPAHDTRTYQRSHVALPGELRRSLANPSSSDNSQAFAWRHTFFLIDPRDDIPVAVERQLTALLLNDMHRVIDWQCHQAMLAQSDATPREHVRLQAQINAFSAVLANAFGTSRPAVSQDGVRVVGSDVVDLTTVPEQWLALTIENGPRTATGVRYVVEYDPVLLDVESSSKFCQLTPHADHADSRIWPYQTADVIVPKNVLPAEGQDVLRLKLRGQQSDVPGRLVVHVVTERSTLRHDIAVQLPPRPLAAVQVKASGNDRWTVDGLELRPFANRSTAYSFSLLGIRDQTDTLEVTAYRVAAPIVAWPAASTLPTAEFHHWLSQASAVHELAMLPTVKVSNRVPAALRFPAIKPEASTPLDLSGGVLIVMHDPARQLSTWEHLPCLPLRPAGYLDAAVSLDEAQDTLRIVIRPHDDLELPSAGIPVRCRVLTPSSLERTTPLKLETAPARSVTGVLQPHQREFALTIPWRDPSDDAIVIVDADSWPRAFVFAVDSDGARPADNFAVEILDPQRRSAVAAPVPSIPISVAVTIPARFTAVTSLVEVGIDRNRDRHLDGEPTLRLPGDRQTMVTLDSVDAAGLWTIKTTVRDWQVSIPTAGLSDQWGTVLARIVQGPHAVWSEGTSVAFDASGPQLGQVAISRNGEFAVGQPIEIRAIADDRGLSGAARVAAGIDPSGLGIISPGTVLIPAKSDGDDRWSVTLPTEKLTPGPYFVVLQATDQVGKTGPVKVLPIRCLTPEEVAARAAARFVSVAGKVQYAGEAVIDADVRLEPIVDKNAPPETVLPPPRTTRSQRGGRFAIDAVAPGQYDLIATGTVRGFRYESRSKVTVKPEEEVAPVQIVFGQKVR